MSPRHSFLIIVTTAGHPLLLHCRPIPNVVPVVVPACASCNTSKCNDEVTRWLRRKGLDERSFLLRHLEIRTALGVSVSCGPEGAGTGTGALTRLGSVQKS